MMAETAAPLFRFVEKPGPHAVGLRVEELYDPSRSFRYRTDARGRPFQGDRARPLQTLIWYPAAQSVASQPLTVEDYGRLWATETRFGEPRMPARAREWLAATSRALATPLWAILNATPAPGRFPLVVYAPSFSSRAWENADLCEYLATHGYVVMAAPSLGATTRNMTSDVGGLNAQAADISFLIGYAQNLANTDPSQIAVAGFSWGGLANLFAAAHDNRIGALVCLDGSLRYWPGMVRQAGNVHPQRMTLPLVSFAKAEWTLEEQARYLTAAQMDGPNVMNAWTHGDFLAIHMLGMTHRQFSSMAQRNEDVWKDFFDPEFPDRQRAGYGREEGMVGYGWVARYTLAFLNAYLKQDAAGMAYLNRQPVDNGVPRHFMDVIYRPARGMPLCIDAFRARIGREGFDRLEEIYGEIRSSNPTDSPFDESLINSWAEELIDEGSLREALLLLQLNTRSHPDSTTAHGSLARALDLSGQKAAAIESYRKALQLSSINAEARRKLQALERDLHASG